MVLIRHIWNNLSNTWILTMQMFLKTLRIEYKQSISRMTHAISVQCTIGSFKPAPQLSTTTMSYSLQISFNNIKKDKEVCATPGQGNLLRGLSLHGGIKTI